MQTQDAAQPQQTQLADPRLQRQEGDAALAETPATAGQLPATAAGQPLQAATQDPRLQASAAPGSRIDHPRVQQSRLQDPRLQAQPTYPQKLVNEAAQQSQQLSSYPQRVLSHAATSPHTSLQAPAPTYPVRLQANATQSTILEVIMHLAVASSNSSFCSKMRRLLSSVLS